MQVSLLTNPQDLCQGFILEIQRMAWAFGCLDFWFFLIDLLWCWSVPVVRTSGRWNHPTVFCCGGSTQSSQDTDTYIHNTLLTPTGLNAVQIQHTLGNSCAFSKYHWIVPLSSYFSQHKSICPQISAAWDPPHTLQTLSKVMAVLLISETLPISWIQVNLQAPSHMPWRQVCINPSILKPFNPSLPLLFIRAAESALINKR